MPPAVTTSLPWRSTDRTSAPSGGEISQARASGGTAQPTTSSSGVSSCESGAGGRTGAYLCPQVLSNTGAAALIGSVSAFGSKTANSSAAPVRGSGRGTGVWCPGMSPSKPDSGMKPASSHAAHTHAPHARGGLEGAAGSVGWEDMSPARPAAVAHAAHATPSPHRMPSTIGIIAPTSSPITPAMHHQQHCQALGMASSAGTPLTTANMHGQFLYTSLPVDASPTTPAVAPSLAHVYHALLQHQVARYHCQKLHFHTSEHSHTCMQCMQCALRHQPLLSCSHSMPCNRCFHNTCNKLVLVTACTCMRHKSRYTHHQLPHQQVPGQHLLSCI